MWVPTGRDSLREEQVRVMKKVEESRIIQIQRSPTPEEAVLDRRTGFFTRRQQEEDRRVVRRVDRTPTLSPSPDRGRNDRDLRRRSGGGASSGRDRNFSDMMNRGDDIRAERERIAREKEEILRKLDSNVALSAGVTLPQPVASSSSYSQLPQPIPTQRSRKDSNSGVAPGGIQFTLDKRLIGGQWAVESSEDEDEERQDGRNRRSWKDEKRDLDNELNRIKSGGREVAKKILPGASSIEDIEKYVSAAKKEKMEKLKQQNKGYLKPRY